MKYEGNQKHKEPWQRGRKGSLCPLEITPELAQKLLDQSREDGGPRYAVFKGKAYKARAHRDDFFHGFPIGFHEVPGKILILWQKEKLVSSRQIRDGW